MSFGEAMPDARDLMTAHGVRHDTLATSSREESWADLAYPRDDRGDGSFYGAGGGLSSSQAPAYPLSEAERQAEEWDKAQVRALVDSFVMSPTSDSSLAVPRHAASLGLTSHSAPNARLQAKRSCDARAPQARFDYKARKRWELEQAQKKAMSLHHRQMERATNRCTCHTMTSLSLFTSPRSRCSVRTSPTETRFVPRCPHRSPHNPQSIPTDPCVVPGYPHVSPHHPCHPHSVPTD